LNLKIKHKILILLQAIILTKFIIDNFEFIFENYHQKLIEILQQLGLDRRNLHIIKNYIGDRRKD